MKTNWKTWAERIRPRGNLVLVSYAEERSVLLPDSAQGPGDQIEFLVLKVGPGRRSPEGVYMQIEVEPGVALKAGDKIVANPAAMMTSTHWQEEKIALISDGEIWAVADPKMPETTSLKRVQ